MVTFNNRSAKTLIITFRDNYEELLDIVADGSLRVIVSELIPRETVDLKPYNETLKSL